MKNTNQLITGREAARRMTLSHPMTTYYSRRYRDFPRPAFVIGQIKLYDAAVVEAWARTHGRPWIEPDATT